MGMGMIWLAHELCWRHRMDGLGRNTNRCGPCQEVEPSMQEFCMIASIMSRKSWMPYFVSTRILCHACCRPDDVWCIINRTKELHRPDIGAGYKAICLQLKVSLTSSWYCRRARSQNVRSASTTHEPASLFQEHLLLPPLQRFCTRLLQQDHL